MAFKDPIGVKKGKTIKSPWNFDQPPYDERSSCFVNAGTKYGVGHRNPVGHEGNPKQRSDVLPYGRVKTIQTDEVYRGPNRNVEIDPD